MEGVMAVAVVVVAVEDGYARVRGSGFGIAGVGISESLLPPDSSMELDIQIGLGASPKAT
jgi:hypothetical protein